MLKLLADENFNNEIVRGIRRRLSNAEITTVQNEGLAGTTDPELLEIADTRGLILVTHDVNTVPGFANERLKNGKPHAGVFAVPQELSIGTAIEHREAESAGGHALLATVVSVCSSTYWRPGARRLVAVDESGSSAITGSISSGCLERDDNRSPTVREDFGSQKDER